MIKNIGILGTGKMGGAIIQGLSKHLNPSQILALDLNPDPKLKKICNYTNNISELEACESVILCIKPQDFVKTCNQLSGKTSYISIAAGISLSDMLGSIKNITPTQVARVMPNLAAVVGKSTTAIFCNDTKLQKITTEIFQTIGSVEILQKESQMHAFTALCGSGPAFVFAFMHALAEGGVSTGLTYEQALKLSLSTIEGCVSILQNSNEHPSTWRNKITSPAGTTIAGLEKLEQGSFHSTITKAIKAAATRSKKLSSEK